MNAEQYLDLVRAGLEGIDVQETEDAIAYLSEYFEEAGKDHEQEVIEELGSPAKYAARIRADLLVDELPPIHSIPPHVPSSENKENMEQTVETSDHPSKRRWKKVGTILLGILALPLAIPLAAAVLILILAALLLLVMIFLMGAMIVLCGGAFCLAAIYAMISTLSSSLYTSLFCLGVALCAAGVVALFAPVLVWIFTKCSQKFVSWISSLYVNLRNRTRKAMNYER